MPVQITSCALWAGLVLVVSVPSGAIISSLLQINNEIGPYIASAAVFSLAAVLAQSGRPSAPLVETAAGVTCGRHLATAVPARRPGRRP